MGIRISVENEVFELEAPPEVTSYDFTEVEWKIAHSDIKLIGPNYSELEPVKLLLKGEVLEIPKNTNTNKLYRWFYKRNLRLKKLIRGDVIYIWVEPPIKKMVEFPRPKEDAS